MHGFIYSLNSVLGEEEDAKVDSTWNLRPLLNIVKGLV